MIIFNVKDLIIIYRLLNVYCNRFFCIKPNETERYFHINLTRLEMPAWHLYEMVTQNMLRTHREKKGIFGDL